MLLRFGLFCPIWEATVQQRKDSKGTRVATVGKVGVEEYQTARGHTQWRFIFRPPDSKKWRREVIAGCPSREAAIAAASKRNEAFFLGTYHNRKTQEDLLRDVMERHKNRCSPGRHPEYQRHTRMVLEFFGAEAIASQLTTEDLERFKSDLLTRTNRTGKRYAPASVAAILRFLIGSLEYATREGRLNRNVGKLVKLPTFNNKRERLWSARELAAVTKYTKPQYGVAILLARHTGIRLGALCSLTWDQIFLEGDHPHIRLLAAQTKTNQARTVPLNTQALDVIRQWAEQVPEQSGRLFAFASSRLSVVIQRTVRKLGFKDLHGHDLRHTWATEHWLRHKDMIRLMVEGGWATPTMVTRYVNMTSADVERARTYLGLSDL